MAEAEASTRPTSTFHYEGEHLHEGVIFSKTIKASRAEEIRNLDLTSSDVIIATFPRSGTTWLCKIVSMVMDLDTLGTKPRNTTQSIHFVDEEHEGILKTSKVIEMVTKRNSPRYIRTHHPVQMLQRQVTQNATKLIVVVRSPRDMLVSYYGYHLSNPRIALTPEPKWDEFFELVKAKKLLYGDWLEHVKGYWRLQHLPNVHFMFYEQLEMEMDENVKRLATFLGKELDEQAIDDITEAVQIEMFRNTLTAHAQAVQPRRKKTKVNFMNEGDIGTWKQYFNRDQDTWVAEHYDVELTKLGIPIHETERL